jgi:hypothetical protein
MMDEKHEMRFWIVWNPKFSTPPSVQHQTIEDARREATRLAQLNPDHLFFVLEAISYCEMKTVQWVDLEVELPF